MVFPAAAWLHGWQVLAEADYRMALRLPGTRCQLRFPHQLLHVPLPCGHCKAGEARAGGWWPVCVSWRGSGGSPDSPRLVPPFAQRNGVALAGILVGDGPFQQALFCLTWCFEDLSPRMEAPLTEMLKLCGCFPLLIVLERPCDP